MKNKKTNNYYSIMYEVKKGDPYFPTTITELVRDIERDERRKKIIKLNEIYNK